MVGVGALGRYRYSSYHWLVEGKRGRQPCLKFKVAFDACGGLRDGPVGRRKYGEYLSALVKKAVVAAGVEKLGGCHLLRHACGTHMLENGADIRYV